MSIGKLNFIGFFYLGPSGQPVECGESPDVISGGDVVGGGVHLHDLDVLSPHLLAELVVDGSELLAVAYRWDVLYFRKKQKW